MSRGQGSSTSTRRWVAWAVVAVVTLFMVAPLVFVVINSVNASSVSQFPPRSFSWRWYHRALADTEFRDGFRLSLRVALGAALLATGAGLLSAYALSRRPGRIARTIQTAINTPLSIPKIAVGTAGLVAYLTLTAWVSSVKPVFSGAAALTILHAAMGLPLAVGVLASAVEAIDPRLERAARDLGARPALAFVRVVLPLVWPAVIIAFAFTFMVSFDELESSLFMASMAGSTLPVAMFVFLENNLDPTLAALSTMLLALTGAFLLAWLPVARRLNRR